MAHQGLSATAPSQYGLDETAPGERTVEVLAGDLQGQGVIFCPNPKMALWSTHPRVFIDLAATGSGRCPYCGTRYRLKTGERVGGH